MLGEEELGASFLITLKHRSVTPDLVVGASRCLADMLEPIEALQISGTDSTHKYELVSGIRSEDSSLRKNETLCDKGHDDLLRPNSFPMALPEDAHWLSDLQCYVRLNCCEFFVAGDSDVKINPASSKRSIAASNGSGGTNCNGGGRRGRVSIGRVGIRCVFCRDIAPSARAAQSTSFPSQISGIYGAVVMMQCRHFNNCGGMPQDVRATLERIRGTRNTSPPPGSIPGEGGLSTNTPGRQQYWAESARKLGLVDTADGIRMSSLETEDSMIASSVAVASQPMEFSAAIVSSSDVQVANAKATGPKSKKHALITPEVSAASGEVLEVPDLSLPSSLHSLMGETTLVLPEDKDLVPDYLFLAMAQMKSCALTESDKVGCYKERDLGFTGMCCKHCGGQPGFGKYYPATVRSLAQTTTSQTIIKHVAVKCRLCPPEIRNAVIALQHSSNDKGCNYSRGPSSANDGRPKYGSRKVFFQRVWGRLHGEDVPDIPYFDEQSPPLISSSSDSGEPNLKIGRTQPQGQRHKKTKVSPNDTDVSIEKDYNEGDVSSIDGGSEDDSSSVASSCASENRSTHSTNNMDSCSEEDESASEGDDESLLPDDRNRRVNVESGGASKSLIKRSSTISTTSYMKRKRLTEEFSGGKSKRANHSRCA